MAARQLSGGLQIGLPEGFDEKLVEISQMPRETGLPALYKALMEASGRGIKTGPRLYLHGAYSDAGIAPAMPLSTRIRTTPIPGAANQIFDPTKLKMVRGSRQEVRTDYTLIVNGVKMPRAWFPVSEPMKSAAGYTTVETPSPLVFSKGVLELDPATEPYKVAVCELHPLNPHSITNVIMKGKVAGIEIVIVQGVGQESDKVIEQRSRGQFQFVPSMDDEAEISRIRMEDDRFHIAGLLRKMQTSRLKEVMRACSAIAPANISGAGDADKRAIMVSSIMSVWDDLQRNSDRGIIEAMCAGTHKSHLELCMEAIRLGVLTFGTEYTMHQGGNDTTLDGLVIPKNFAGREAEFLAIKMSEDDSLELFQIQLEEATRYAATSEKVGSRRSDIAEAVQKLIDAKIIVVAGKNNGWCLVDPDDSKTLNTVAHFHHMASEATRMEKLMEWARREGIEKLKILLDQ